ncbi:MAG: ribbon-helix-helix domain-containing protein [Deltaproteobacteria bacterium]|nr:ribbon-helix-helix domain-containing protein [Deltaproteobacteria bacterium]
MAKVRFQMFIDERQKEALERLQHDYKVSVAEIIRKAIDRLLTEYKAKEERPLRDSMAEKLLSSAGACKGGPKDMADEHDKYLYGMPGK